MNISLSFKNPAVRFGLLGGVASIIITLFTYVLGPEAFHSYSLLILILLFAIIIASGIYTVKDIKRKQSGYLNFSYAVSSLVLCFAIIGLFYNIFYFSLFNFIDPQLQEQLKYINIRSIEENPDRLPDMTDEERSAFIEALRGQEIGFSVSDLGVYFLIWMVITFVIALVIAAITKNEETGT